MTVCQQSRRSSAERVVYKGYLRSDIVSTVIINFNGLEKGILNQGLTVNITEYLKFQWIGEGYLESRIDGQYHRVSEIIYCINYPFNGELIK